MPTVTGAQRLLVKARGGAPRAAFGLGVDRVTFRAEPLFGSAPPARLAATAPSTWHILTPERPLDEVHAWDLCHQLLTGGLGVDDGTSIEFAEPDFEQQWEIGAPADVALAISGACDTPAPQSESFPRLANDLWFRDDEHAQFDAALKALGAPAGDRVRVVHLDTGYDPNHRTLPEHLEPGMARNFVDADRPNDATDPSVGHGTGTLSILAGKALPSGMPVGAAPFVNVVPVRVATSVVLFRSSALAQAFDYVLQLCADPATPVHIITMSMGGIASQAWAEKVNALYEAGVFVVTAAGNNFGNLPTHNIVFPARFGRVVAACGIMADHAPYADLGLPRMAGDYGPPRKMRTAMAAYTPNVPWARLGCPEAVNFDGAGTSAATPQVAAAAAIWVQRHKAEWEQYPEPWMRVEAVREALFTSANDLERDHLGRGALRAADALGRAPAAPELLQKEPEDAADFPILRLFFGQQLAAADTRQRMLELEALQLSQQSEAVARELPDPTVDPTTLNPVALRRIASALADDPRASQALREALGAVGPRVFAVPEPVALPDAVRQQRLAYARHPEPPTPTLRRLRIYTYDPSRGTHVETLGVSETVVAVPWEAALQPGPVGDYLEVLDVDPASECCYAPVDLNHPHLLVQDGLAPSEANPQFHQQMAYAVVMTTIEHFERALGRVALWAPRLLPESAPGRRDVFVRRLRIYPHALRIANAFYSPDRKALLLGYFTATTASADVPPGGLVFSALSHDILAHESTHALLDGLHRRFNEPTNPDVLAFHEAFADIVALFQHFSLPAALRQQVAQTRGDLGQENLLAQLAVEFGQATGRYGALRDAIGTIADHRWVPRQPSADDYHQSDEPHAHGAVLVAAVFDAFLQIYRARTADIIRLATGGSGVLPPGAIPVDLADRLADEASKVATHVLNICIRALDYCPPVDITFGEYLRALITADRDLVPEDQRLYRVAFISAFRARGIYPDDVKSLSEGSLLWEPPPVPLGDLEALLASMSLGWDLSADRHQAYELSRANAIKLRQWLMGGGHERAGVLALLGLSRVRRDGERRTIGGVAGELRPIEVHSVRPARRIGPDGQLRVDLVVEITQSFRPDPPVGGRFRGGCTLIFDVQRGEARYAIMKRVDSAKRLAKQQQFALAAADLRDTYFTSLHPEDTRFALLHQA